MVRGLRRLSVTGVCLVAGLMAPTFTADASIAHDRVVSDDAG